ncbi:elongin-B [Microcebus murinus]|uniref:elongin-B n=1 Tax=Microcebus murinus TaxID=30608 RepID=UPI003F6CF3AD
MAPLPPLRLPRSATTPTGATSASAPRWRPLANWRAPLPAPIKWPRQGRTGRREMGRGRARGMLGSARGAGNAAERVRAGASRGEAAAEMDVFLMIRRHKTTIFTDAKESSTVFELKRIVEGILKRPPDEQRLYKDDQLLDDGKTLGECGFTSQTARPQAPATVGLAFRADDAFEALRIEPFSSPPELPDVMKPQDSGSSANEQAVQ